METTSFNAATNLHARTYPTNERDPAETHTASSQTTEKTKKVSFPSLTPEKVDALIRGKLKEQKSFKGPNEKIAVLMRCLELGEKEAEKIKDDEAIVLIGNTEAGKSTFINYAGGCNMERKNTEDVKGASSESDTVIVVKAGGIDQIMEPGHGKKSKTFTPHIWSGEGRTWVDCPGFVDSRGPEIDLANAVNIKNILTKPKRVKVILLVNYDDFRGSRGKGVIDTIKKCADLFGSKENISKHKNSLLVGITKIQTLAQNKSPKPLDDLKEKFIEASKNDASVKAVVKDLLERIFIFDCEDKDLIYDGSWKRDQILRAIDRLTPISNPSKIFKPAISDENKIAIMKISNDFQIIIENILKKESLTEEDLITAANCFSILRRLEVMENYDVNKLIENVRERIIDHFNKTIRSFLNKFSLNNLQNIQEVETTIEKIKSQIKYFDDVVKRKVNIIDLECLFNNYKKRQIQQASLLDLQLKEKEFYEYCRAGNTEAAAKHIKLIIKMLAVYEKEYDIKEIHLISVEKLEEDLKAAEKICKEKVEAEEKIKGHEQKITEMSEQIRVKDEESKKISSAEAFLMGLVGASLMSKAT